jgi:hypothetical protein
MKNLTWNQFIFDKVKSGKSNIYYLNQEIADKCKNLVGFYQYTKEKEFDRTNCYKCGQTTIGAVERISQQITASATDDIFVIAGFIPSDLATIKNEDQRILKQLHNRGECIRLKTINEDVNTKEWAIFPNGNPEEVILDYLNKVENGLFKKDASLTIWQIEVLDRLISLLDEDAQKIVAELAARFGKTLLYLMLFGYLNRKVMIVGSYYLTALTSFKKEIAYYNDFSNFEILDLYDLNFQSSFESLLSQEKKIVVTASLCGDKEKDETTRNQNAEFISKFTDKITVIDEADYGAHTKVCAPFVDKIGSGGPIILTTGTNSERAAKNQKIDAAIGCTYLDMQMKALSDKIIIKNDFIRKIKRAVEFEKNLVKMEFCRYDWSPFVKFLAGNNPDFNPAFSKCSEDVNKNIAFWTGLYQTLLGVSPNMDLNDHSLSNFLDGKAESIIQFLNINNTQLKHLEKIARSVLNQFYDVYAICGDYIKGKDAEQFVKDKIIKAKLSGKKVWILASQMCQRSFSVADINVVLLSYDKGDSGATNQKISRAATNGNFDKTAYIISLSIDGNRDDKIAPMIMDAAEQVAKHEGISLPNALRIVMKTSPIFQLDEDGCRVKLLADDYAKELFSTSKGIRLAINREAILISDFGNEAFDILSNLNVSSPKIKEILDFPKGRTFKPGQKNHRLTKKQRDDLLSHVQQNLANILENLTSTMQYQKVIRDRITYPELIHLLDSEKDSRNLVGVNGKQFSTLVDHGFIKKGILETFVERN